MANFEGLTAEKLQTSLLVHIRAARGNTRLSPDAVAIASALISLRRSGALVYRADDHTAQLNYEAITSDDRRLSIVWYNALLPGCPVQLSGENVTAVIMYVEICHDLGDIWPAPWYIAVLANSRACRAFGADDLEPLLGQRGAAAGSSQQNGSRSPSSAVMR